MTTTRKTVRATETKAENTELLSAVNDFVELRAHRPATTQRRREAQLKAQIIFQLAAKVSDATIPDDIDVNQLTDRMISAIPLEQYWQETLGPFYDAKGIADSLNISKQAVSAMEKDGKVLGLRGSGGTRVLYPSFQFSSQMEPLPRMAEVIAAYGRGPEGAWTLARWLQLPSRRFGGHSAAQAMRAGNTGAVLAAIRADAGNRAA